ncbi:hypothetical protein BIY23_04330 [Wolbachia pipientis]|uniref:Uncharacterized protein n=1 Tax=Wolbachia pipientis TaxID=955 RepID=A0A1E7QIX5_WOLPI|nr:GNAT family protein [Wolbachia pipientis]OEY86423.1 hypothetical protein BIY23_04330 [Wolbachia pipientis]
MELKKIYINCSTLNRKSQAIAERLNFIREEIIKDKEFLYDLYNDHIIYSITHKEQESCVTSDAQVEVGNISCLGDKVSK